MMSLSAVTGFAARLRARLEIARGRRHLARGELREAQACCKKSLSICETHGDAHRLLAEAVMPGEDYLGVLSRIHARLQPVSYVEIGVRFGKSLALAGDRTTAVGIDPRFAIDRDIRSRSRLYPLASDEFFSRYDLFEELRAPRLALAMIDGLHLFEQALKDFVHLERFADSRTVILIHDCLPVCRLVASRKRRSMLWCGDVWKIVPCLRKNRPDLDVRIIPARPSGLAVVTGADPQSTRLMDDFDRIVAECHELDLGYDFLDSERLGKTAGILPNDPESLDEAISAWAR
jgi:hypothetical protein